MSDKPKVLPLLKNTATAPMIYFDQAPTLGVSNSVVEIDLSARVMNLFPGGSVKNDNVCVAHLKCSIEAAVSLREAINKALAMAKYESPAHDDFADEEPSPGAAFEARMKAMQ